MMDEKKCNKIFQNLLADFSQEIGFKFNLGENTKYNPPYLKRETTAGYELIGDLYLDYFNQQILMNNTFTKRINVIEDIWARYYSQLHPVSQNFSTHSLVTIVSNVSRITDFQFDPENKMKWMRIKDKYEDEATELGVQRIFDRVKSNILTHTLPFLQKYNSVKDINSVMNYKPGTYFECMHLFTANGLMFKKMIVSKLAGNKDHSVICSLMKEMIQSSFEAETDKRKYLNVWDAINESL
jgi:hypothetical protein